MSSPMIPRFSTRDLRYVSHVKHFDCSRHRSNLDFTSILNLDQSGIVKICLINILTDQSGTYLWEFCVPLFYTWTTYYSMSSTHEQHTYMKAVSRLCPSQPDVKHIATSSSLKILQSKSKANFPAAFGEIESASGLFTWNSWEMRAQLVLPDGASSFSKIISQLLEYAIRANHCKHFKS